MKIDFKEWHRNTICKWIPGYGSLALVICFSVNGLVYWGTQLIMGHKKHYDFTSAIDNRIPFVKEWVGIYLICYVFWIFNYILVTREGKEKLYRFVFADVLSRIVCGIIFIILPTTNVRPIVPGTDLFSSLMRYVYAVDPATNLFPSIHCLVSWFCFIGIRNSERVSFWYKAFSCIFSILVFASTQFTKQHYLIDVAGAVIIAELCYFIACHTNIYISVEKIIAWAGRRIFGEINYDEKAEVNCK